MLAKVNRLPSYELRKTLQSGKRINFPQVSFIYKPNGNQASRFGFVVGTNIDKRAVVRNRLKRRLRESIRLLLPKIKTGFDVIILARKGLIDMTMFRVKELTQTILRKAGLFNHETMRQ